MKRMRMFKRIAVVMMLGVALSGCSTIKGWFQGKDAAAKKAQEPAELVKFDPLIKVDKLWSVDLGKGERRIGVRQRPVVVGDRIYAAALSDGVRAIDLHSGDTVWHVEPKKDPEGKDKKKNRAQISGGPGAADGLVVVGTLDGQVIALDATDGSEKWRAKVHNEVIAAPTVSQNMVFVRSNDGRVTAFDAATGKQKWYHDKETPSLTVRGNSPVLAAPGVVFIGNDDGTMTALSAPDGRDVWEQVIGNPEGRTELERMADVDGAAVLEGTTIYATSYRGTTMAIEGPSGRPLWSQDHGSATGVAVSSGLVILADNDGTVWGLEKPSGSPMWSQAALARRQLTGVAIQGDYVVVGDYKGYVHWLRMSDGKLAARERVGHHRIVGQPLVAEGILLVQNSRGKLTAFRQVQ